MPHLTFPGMRRIRPRALPRALTCVLLLAFGPFASFAMGGTVQYTYDAVGRLVSVTNADSSVTTYTYDAAGNRAVVQPLMGSFSASPPAIASGESSSLAWGSANATGAVIDHGVGSVSPLAGGSVTVSPSSTTTYTLTLAGPGGPLLRQVTVTVSSGLGGSSGRNAHAVAATAGHRGAVHPGTRKTGKPGGKAPHRSHL